tara:strand:+ start:85 stop:864 length:780 start_codon:yes stop_codon:yes gene_type:complete
MHTKYKGQIKDRAISSKMLRNRLNLNKKISSKDLHSWQFSRMEFKKGENILDLGCGTGKQSLKISSIVGKQGKVCAIDLSKESIQKLRKDTKIKNIISLADSIDNIADILPKVKLDYDKIISTYAIYYSANPAKVLKLSSNFLKENGKFYITVPTTPHGMVNFASKFSKVPKNVTESINVGNKILIPFFKKNFKKVKIYKFNNIIRFNNFHDFYSLYKSTTYFNSRSQKKMKSDFEKIMKKNKIVKFEKKALLIEATKK